MGILQNDENQNFKLKLSDGKMTALKKIVFICLIAVVRSQECPKEDPADPFEGVDKIAEEFPYPEKEISVALERDPKTKAVISKAAADAEAVSKLAIIPAFTRSDDLCKSKFVTHYPRGWTYIGASGHRCWILNYWWTTAISYDICPRQTCSNLPCFSRRHYCVPSNYKVYVAWAYCRGSGFQYRKFNLPQCCECKQFKC